MRVLAVGKRKGVGLTVIGGLVKHQMSVNDGGDQSGVRRTARRVIS